MTRRIRAAVLERPGAGLAIEELDLADPARDEVLVRIDAAGVCHSDRPDGTTAHHLMGVSCFAEYAIVSERAVVAIPPGVPADIAAITGCAVITGVGTVLNAIGPCAGQGLVVFGAGGVGLSVVMGAVLAGAYPIVAVDMVAERPEAATRLGATHVVDASSEDVAAALADIDVDGLDYAVEAIGRPATLRQGFDALVVPA
jgi:Zn-dependent alcohol dehydrogenase